MHVGMGTFHLELTNWIIWVILTDVEMCAKFNLKNPQTVQLNCSFPVQCNISVHFEALSCGLASTDYSATGE